MRGLSSKQQAHFISPTIEGRVVSPVVRSRGPLSSKEEAGEQQVTTSPDIRQLVQHDYRLYKRRAYIIERKKTKNGRSGNVRQSKIVRIM